MSRWLIILPLAAFLAGASSPAGDTVVVRAGRLGDRSKIATNATITIVDGKIASVASGANALKTR